MPGFFFFFFFLVAAGVEERPFKKVKLIKAARLVVREDFMKILFEVNGKICGKSLIIRMQSRYSRR